MELDKLTTEECMNLLKEDECKLTKEKLNEFAAFIKQVEVDASGSPKNVEILINQSVWQKTVSTYCFNIEYFLEYSYRIKPKTKTKTRPMDYREAEQLYGTKVMCIDSDGDKSYFAITGVTANNIFVGRNMYNYELFHKHFTRPDGTKFEVEDE